MVVFKLSVIWTLGILPFLAVLIVITQAAPTGQEEAESRFMDQTEEEDEGEFGDVMALSDDVIIDALFTNLDTLQDELEICEEGLRLKVSGVEMDYTDMVDNDFIHDPDNILGKLAGEEISRDSIRNHAAGNSDADNTSDGDDVIISVSFNNSSFTDDGNASSSSSSSTGGNSSDHYTKTISSSSSNNDNNNNNSNVNTTNLNSNNSSSSSSSNNNSTIFDAVNNMGEEGQTKVFDFQHDMVPYLVSESDDAESEAPPTHSRSNNHQHTPYDTREFAPYPRDGETIHHSTSVKVIHHESKSHETPSKTGRGPLGENQYQRRARPGKSHRPNPTALVVKRLSQRLEDLKRWVIECHIMYKMFE